MPSELQWPNSELNRIDASKMIELHFFAFCIDRMGLLAPNTWGRTSSPTCLRGSVIGTSRAPFAQAATVRLGKRSLYQTPWISSFESELSRLRTRFQGRKPVARVARVSFSPTCRCPPFCRHWPCVFTWLRIEMGRAVEPFPIFWVLFQADGKIRMPK